MTVARTVLYVCIAFGIVLGSVPAAAVTATDGDADAHASALQTDDETQTTADETDDNSTVNVTVGQQLSTVLSVTRTDVQSDVEETAFELSIETERESERAEAVAERVEQLRDRAMDVREDYRETTEAYEAGELSTSEYAQRLAVLNARAQSVVDASERTRRVAANVSSPELRTVGYDHAELRGTVTSLDNLTGSSTSALLQRFVGEREGEIELEVNNGLSIEVENEDGERSREFRRPRDGTTNITISNETAFETARGSLPDVNGTWVLTNASVDTFHGTYRFRFRLLDDATEGRAKVRVDGSSGAVVRYEEEFENADDEREDESEDEREDELTLAVTAGTPAPGETVTVTVFLNGTAASDVVVSLDGTVIGTTGADGTVTATLPQNDDAKFTAERGEAEGELELEFDDDEDRRRAYDVIATADNRTVSVSVTHNGSGVQDAVVYADGERVGMTGSDGTFTFVTDAREDLELKIVKGEFEFERTFALVDGSFSAAGAEGDEDEREDEREDEDEDEKEDDDDDDNDDDDDGDADDDDDDDYDDH